MVLGDQEERSACWVLIATLVTAAVALDVWYPIHHHTLVIKAYAFAFPIGLLDLWLGSTRVDRHSQSAGGGVAVVRLPRLHKALADRRVVRAPGTPSHRYGLPAPFARGGTGPFRDLFGGHSPSAAGGLDFFTNASAMTVKISTSQFTQNPRS